MKNTYFFPLDNLHDFMIRGTNDLSLQSNNVCIEFDAIRGSFLTFTATNSISKSLSSFSEDKRYDISFFVKFNNNEAHHSFFKLGDDICVLSISETGNLRIQNREFPEKISSNIWYNFTVEIQNNEVTIFLDSSPIFPSKKDDSKKDDTKKDDTKNDDTKIDTSKINSITLQGESISFSDWKVECNDLFSSKLDNAVTNEPINILFSVYNKENDKSHLFLENESLPVHLDINFKHEINIDAFKDINAKLSAKQGFFSLNEQEKNVNYTIKNGDLIITLNQFKKSDNGNSLTHDLSELNFLNISNQDRIFLHLELFNFTMNNTSYTEDEPLKIDHTVLVKDNRGHNICPFDSFIKDGDTFTYQENYDKFEGQDLIICLENITDESLILTKDKATFSIDLRRFDLFETDKLQTKNISIRHKDKTITYKLITHNDTVLEYSLTQEIIIQPQEYLQFSISGLKIKPSAHSVGKYPFYINYKNIANYRNGKSKFVIHSSIIDKGSYIGDWRNGKYHGKGKLTWTDVAVYEGEFKDGVKHGQGKNTWANGDVYEGEYKDDKHNGYGIYTTKTKDNEYKGYYMNGKRDGYGVKTDANGDYYDGQWKDNKKNGFGVSINGPSNYLGNWKDDKKNGFGILKDTFNLTYIGMYKDDNVSEYTVIFWPEGAIYLGGYNNIGCNGKGTLLFPSGNHEVGYFKDGKCIINNFKK